MNRQKQRIAAEARKKKKARDEAEFQKLAGKQQLEKRATEVIYEWVGRWVGKQIEIGSPIPVFRNGEKVAELTKGSFPIKEDFPSEVHSVLTARLTENRQDIKNRLERYKKLKDTIQVLSKNVDDLTGQERAALEMPHTPFAQHRALPLVERIIMEIGSVNSSLYGLSQVSVNLDTETQKLTTALTKQPPNLGRPRKEAAHQTALALAKLYSKVTGKRPRYSEDPNGLHGEFTPALRDLFDVLDPSWRDLSGPANYAKSEITEEDLVHPKSPSLHSLLQLGLKMQDQK